MICEIKCDWVSLWDIKKFSDYIAIERYATCVLYDFSIFTTYT